MIEPVLVSAVRTPVGRAYKGTLRTTRPDDLAALVIKEALTRVPGLSPADVDDVILGCAMPEGEQGMNVARIAALRAGLPVQTSAMTVNRFCSSGLQAIALAADRIRSGGAEVIIAGGTESMSMVPMGGNKISPNPWLVDHYPDAYINMGLGTENIARKFAITREAADQFAMDSHRKAVAAIAAGKFKDETLPVEVKITSLLTNGNGTGKSAKPQKPSTQTVNFDTDELPRADTSLEALAKLKPAFHAAGSVTAGNSSPMSDGAAAVVVMSDARQSSGSEASGPLRGLRHRRVPARRIRHRPGSRHSQGAQASRSAAQRHQSDRIKRSVRCAISRGDSTGRPGPGKRES
jgi:acetyl-CoA acyltransferase